MDSKIAILILHWKNVEDTLECLRSVSKINYPNFEIILINNDAHVFPEFPNITYICNETNLGFAEGNNRGIRYALDHGADYIFLLNNDTIVQDDILNQFMQAVKEFPQAGVLGAKIYYYDEPATLWYAGGEVDLHSLRCYHEGVGEADIFQKYDTIKPTGYACGCALFIKAEAIREVGMMDPKFFLLWEEVDWCWRLAKAGYPSYFVPKAKVWHKVSASFEGGNQGPQRKYYYYRNRLLFMRKNVPFLERMKFYIRFFTGEFLYLTKTREDLTSRACLKGTKDYFLNRFG